MNTASFYHEFEANFRGSRQEIMARLEVYIAFLKPLIGGDERPQLIDVGCGRGEWLEITGAIGMDAHGVDLDEGMLQDCWDRGLSAEKTDAIAYLASLPDNSQSVVSGFHIAEHLPFEALQSLIGHALRVLKPGGLLIVETPNAENISVGTLSFHMDPTHVRPLPPGLLSFLPRFHGFHRAKVLRLQENRTLSQTENVRLIDVFEGVSPDYAVVAQKHADAAYLAQWDDLFATDFGLTLNTLSQRFEAGYVSRSQFESFKRDITEDFEKRFDEIALQNMDYQNRLEAVYGSTSWRVTKPLRDLRLAMDKARQFEAKQRLKKMFAAVLRKLMLTVLSFKPARQIGRRLAARYPAMAGRLKRILVPPFHASLQMKFTHGTSEASLTPKARSIYAKLKKASDTQRNA